jgi:hypothetical protein
VLIQLITIRQNASYVETERTWRHMTAVSDPELKARGTKSRLCRRKSGSWARIKCLDDEKSLCCLDSLSFRPKQWAIPPNLFLFLKAMNMGSTAAPAKCLRWECEIFLLSQVSSTCKGANYTACYKESQNRATHLDNNPL